MMPIRVAVLILLTVSSTRAFASDVPPLQMAYFSRCDLENGTSIEDCQIGYRVYGEPNADGSNVVALPTWYTGQSQDWNGLLGATKLIDPDGLAIVVLDAFADGISSSPSTSATQPRREFPSFSLADQVRWHHAVLTKVLGLPHVKAVMGISMGGMQALQWAVSYPDYEDVIVNMVGTPRPTDADTRPWKVQLRAMDMTLVDFKGIDQRYQLDAMIHHDITGGTSLIEAAQRIHARVLMVVAAHDGLVTSQPSLELASRLPNSGVLLLNSACGHLAPALCKRDESRRAIMEFLQGQPATE